MTVRRNSQSSGFTLADVAREANVSEITVSRVIRAKGPISEETRRRVEKAIVKVGYVPNRIAGSLASSTSSDLIGVILPSLGNIVFPDVLRGINEALAQRDFKTVVSVTDYRPEAESKLVRSLLSWRPAALIITGCDHDDETRAMLCAAGITIIEIMDVGATPVDIAIGMSHEAAGRATALHLLQRDFRKFGYIGHDLALDNRARRRRNGFVEAVQRSGAELVAEIVIPGPSSAQAGRAALADMLAQPSDIDAVYFSNDDMAIGGVFHCMAAGISLPDTLAIAGFNGLEIGQSLPQPLTTVRSKRFEIGTAAGQAVLDRFDGREVAPVNDVGFELILGATA